MGARTKTLKKLRTTRSRKAASPKHGLLPRAREAGRELSIEWVSTKSLSPSAKNVRIHGEKQVAKIADSISAFGFICPIVVDSSGVILAGHGRHAAAQILQMRKVPVVQISHLSDTEKRLFALADNRLAELADWDEAALVIELKSLEQISVKLDLDIEVTGFDTVDLDRLLVPVDQSTPDPADEAPPLDHSRAINCTGDLWLLGEHKLLCGNALDAADYSRLLGDERASLVFTDPPYNVRIPGHVSGNGRHKHQNFVMASGEMSPEEFTLFLRGGFENLARFSKAGSIHYVAMDWRHIAEITRAAEPVFGALKNLAVWVKTNGGQGNFYRSQHELIFIFKSGQDRHINNFGLGSRGRYRTNVWVYPGVNTIKPGRDSELAMHPTVKPVAMVADALKDCSKRGDIVLDPFAGSGTLAIAAERTGRRARLIELDPKYADVIITRWQHFSKKVAVLASNGLSFEQVQAQRTTSDLLPDSKPLGTMKK